MSDAKYYYAARIEADGGATEIDGAQVVLAEDYDRLREVLEKIAAMPLSASWRQHFYDAVKMAQDATGGQR